MISKLFLVVFNLSSVNSAAEEAHASDLEELDLGDVDADDLSQLLEEFTEEEPAPKRPHVAAAQEEQPPPRATPEDTERAVVRSKGRDFLDACLLLTLSTRDEFSAHYQSIKWRIIAMYGVDPASRGMETGSLLEGMRGFEMTLLSLYPNFRVYYHSQTMRDRFADLVMHLTLWMNYLREAKATRSRSLIDQTLYLTKLYIDKARSFIHLGNQDDQSAELPSDDVESVCSRFKTAVDLANVGIRLSGGRTKPLLNDTCFDEYMKFSAHQIRSFCGLPVLEADNRGVNHSLISFIERLLPRLHPFADRLFPAREQNQKYRRVMKAYAVGNKRLEEFKHSATRRNLDELVIHRLQYITEIKALLASLRVSPM
jgi:hypothetical protein